MTRRYSAIGVRAVRLALLVLLTLPVGRGALGGPALDAYGGTTALQGKKTGFFHVETIGGRYLLITPEGNGFFALGMDGLGHYPDAGQGMQRGWSRPDTGPELAAFDALLKRKYPTKESWAEAQFSRIRAWGFNAFSGDPSRSAPNVRMPYTIILGVSGRRSDAFKDVFSKAFEEAVAKATERAAEKKNDPWLIGYFSDNELPWAMVWGGGHLDDYLRLSKDAPGRREALAHLEEAFKTVDRFNKAWDLHASSFDAIMDPQPGPRFDRARVVEVRDQFLEKVARRYYGFIYKAFKASDPNHMVMGSRFLTGEVPLSVARGMKGNVDVVSTNCYAVRTFPAAFLQAFSDAAGAPILITEWGYSAKEGGVPVSNSGAIPRVLETQKDRADKYEWYVRCAAAQKFVVGVSWWWYLDGWNGTPPGNYGFVSWKDEPWQELAERARAVNGTVYQGLVGKTLSCSVPPPTTYAIKRTAPLTMDGDPKKYAQLDIVLDATNKYEGYDFAKSGLGAEAAVLQDDANVYVAVKVNDAEVITYSKDWADKNKINVWETDGVEIRFGRVQALCSFDQKKPVCTMVPTDPFPGLETSGRIFSGGYFVEMKMPKANLADVIHDGTLRFAIGVNDGKAGARYRQLQWPESFEWIYTDTYALGRL
jgi:hypothetical protein